jgi:four helix bundle protein
VASQDFRDLELWKQGIGLVKQLYLLTASFPSDERYGLTSQIRRAAVSVPANVAEGQSRLHRGDFVHHLSIARGSLAELETHIIIAESLGFLSADQTGPVVKAIHDLRRMTHGLIASLSRSDQMHGR